MMINIALFSLTKKRRYISIAELKEEAPDEKTKWGKEFSFGNENN